MLSHDKLYSKTSKPMPMTPPVAQGGILVILKWGKDPKDLDLHGITSRNEHVYWKDKVAGPNFQLDKDDMNGNGFETMTLSKMLPDSKFVSVIHLVGLVRCWRRAEKRSVMVHEP